MSQTPPDTTASPEPDARRKRRILLAILVALLLVLVLGIWASQRSGDEQEGTGGRRGDGSDRTSSSTTTGTPSSTTKGSGSSTTGATTATTAAPSGPEITSFTMSPNFIYCAGGDVDLTLSWTTLGATSVVVSIDGPGAYNTFGPNGSETVGYSCPGPHTYMLTAKNAGGQSVVKTATVSSHPAP